MDKDEALQALFGSIIDEMKESSNKKLEEITKSVEEKAEKLESKMTTSLKKLDDLLDNKPITVNFGTVEKPDNEVTHKAFDRILKVLQSTKRKEKHIMLVGGAGGGKTHLAGQIAKALKIPFYPMSVGLQTTKSDLLGFINATGGYIDSPVRKAYENGGLLLLDEFDATHAGVVTILNSLLANGHATFPDKIVEKHKDFVCMCACNTYGRGGNIDYIGRNKLDGATLDRFIVIDVDYDNGLERNLTNNDDWVDALEKMRENIAKQGIKMIISPRASMDGADLLEAGFDIKDVMEMVIYKGCNDDIKKKITQGIALSRIRKRPNRKEALPAPDAPSVVESDEETFERLIYLDFDEYKYKQKNMENSVIGCSNYNSSFTLYVGHKPHYYSTYLEGSSLYINNETELVGFDRFDKSLVEHFMNSMAKHCGGYHDGKPFDMIIVKDGEKIHHHFGA